MKKYILGILFLVMACTGDAVDGEGISLTIDIDGETYDVTCQMTIDTGAVDGSHCEHYLTQCSDGSEYGLECEYNNNTEMTDCTCVIDGDSVLDFEVESICPIQTEEVVSNCGWEN